MTEPSPTARGTEQPPLFGSRPVPGGGPRSPDRDGHPVLAGAPASAATRQGGPVTRPVARGPRRARLMVKHVDPWSVLKFSLLFSIGLLVVFVVAVAVLYAVLDAMGVFSSVNDTVRDLTSSSPDGAGGIRSLLTGARVIGGAALIGAVNVVLVTALATLGAFLYNLCADLVGGVEVTFTERG